MRLNRRIERYRPSGILVIVAGKPDATKTYLSAMRGRRSSVADLDPHPWSGAPCSAKGFDGISVSSRWSRCCCCREDWALNTRACRPWSRKRQKSRLPSSCRDAIGNYRFGHTFGTPVNFNAVGQIKPLGHLTLKGSLLLGIQEPTGRMTISTSHGKVYATLNAATAGNLFTYTITGGTGNGCMSPARVRLD